MYQVISGLQIYLILALSTLTGGGNQYFELNPLLCLSDRAFEPDQKYRLGQQLTLRSSHQVHLQRLPSL